MDRQMDRRIDGQNFFPFYRILSPVGAAAQKVSDARAESAFPSFPPVENRVKFIRQMVKHSYINPIITMANLQQIGKDSTKVHAL